MSAPCFLQAQARTAGVFQLQQPCLRRRPECACARHFPFVLQACFLPQCCGVQQIALQQFAKSMPRGTSAAQVEVPARNQPRAADMEEILREKGACGVRCFIFVMVFPGMDSFNPRSRAQSFA
jgi:hypothetical protein